ncbi:hypothetical protein E4T56_gene1092 [Termitomyces sp. T112]|nr:hypothetical protein E4T56_gene1092 [Termitomyces sp. T112]
MSIHNISIRSSFVPHSSRHFITSLYIRRATFEMTLSSHTPLAGKAFIDSSRRLALRSQRTIDILRYTMSRIFWPDLI